MTIGATALVTGGALFATTPLGASGGDDATFVPITSCRLFDTRPAPQTIGPRATPLGPAETIEVQVTGSNGNCTIPTHATAIAINATAVGATATSYATFFPAGAERPLSSSLNYVADAPPIPNATDVRLSSDGRMEVFNAFGSVHLIGDVTGYYSRSALSELTSGLADKADADVVYTRDEIDALLASVTVDGYSKDETDALIGSVADDGYSKDEIDVLLASVAGDGYSDDEIDALLLEKSDRVNTYAKIEVDAAIAAAVTGKADLADVYTKAELDALHQLLSTKDEVDELLIAERVWAADVDDNGDELADGPYTSTRLGVGWYRVQFQLAPYGIPDTVEPIVAASGRCGGITAVVGKMPTLLGGTLQLLTVDVITFNHGGVVTDCALDVMVRLVD